MFSGLVLFLWTKGTGTLSIIYSNISLPPAGGIPSKTLKHHCRQTKRTSLCFSDTFVYVIRPAEFNKIIQA